MLTKQCPKVLYYRHYDMLWEKPSIILSILLPHFLLPNNSILEAWGVSVYVCLSYVCPRP
jgi:hypothetical protein